MIVLSASFSLADSNDKWKSDWALDYNFSISIDTSGYDLPTSIVFVPNPGKGPKDPLYFVIELGGKVKVVTNDRTVHVFAEDFFRLESEKKLPAVEGEVGLAGICLEPENGYVFVTFAYQDSKNVLRNNVVRFETQPIVFSLKPISMMDFSQVFVRNESRYSHQIGPCQVYDNLLYVNVGDGFRHLESQQLDSTLGKILRMTLDGKPVITNPYYLDDGRESPRDYVWAYGFRNPFSLDIVDGRVFVADNGLGSDRFLEVHKGQNSLWDGTDWSIGTNTNVVFSPSVAPVQVDYYPKGLEIFPLLYRGKFYMALAGRPNIKGPSYKGSKSIVMLDFGFKENRMLSAPKHFLKYRGEELQLLTGLGIGPDGLYFVPLYPDAQGQSSVFKVQYDESDSHPYKIWHETGKRKVLSDKGCLGCHSFFGLPGGNVGPNLDTEPLVKRLNKRLNSKEYLESLIQIDKLDTEPYISYKDARQKVLQEEGQEKLRTWIKFHLMEPRFDNPSAQMPNLGISEEDAIILTDFLLDNTNTNETGNGFISSYIPQLQYKHLVYSLVMGGFLSFLVLLVFYMLYRRKR
ncbi:MAG: PQQ-dependent sugar dehydrogenase [Thermodesulfobacteriota bacterium]